ncbi:MAG: photosynthetic complex putative assembly protein PuhB [Hyphomonas sp.]
MIRLHDEEDGGGEPVPGLPENLPDGERIVWQGKPDMMAFAIHVFHVRFVLAYFVGAASWRLAHAASSGAGEAMPAILVNTLVGAFAAMGLLFLIAWAMARSTIYTITTRRVVLRFGVAIRKYVNLPFDQVSSADFTRHGSRKGDIQLVLAAPRGISYLRLWPHVRPLRFSRPRPLLRALKDVRSVAEILAQAIAAHAPDKVSVKPLAAKPASPSPMPAGIASSLS